MILNKACREYVSITDAQYSSSDRVPFSLVQSLQERQLYVIFNIKQIEEGNKGELIIIRSYLSLPSQYVLLKEIP